MQEAGGRGRGPVEGVRGGKKARGNRKSEIGNEERQGSEDRGQSLGVGDQREAMTVKSFRDLQVWRAAIEWLEEIYRLIRTHQALARTWGGRDQGAARL
jgi:hypothetical protein